ncbi:MAG: permease prefix domain 2-containing transporter [Bacteroidota bacterium]
MQDKNIKNPPQWALRFFRWFCLPEMVEDIEGDLLERYQIKYSQDGISKANRYFNYQVLLLFRPGIVNYRKFLLFQNNTDMLKKYLQFSGRQLLNAKNYAVINIFVYVQQDKQAGSDPYG